MNGAHGRWMILMVLLATWGGAGMWLWSSADKPVRVPLKNVSGRQPIHQGPNGHVGGLQVQIDLLTASRDRRSLSFPMARNIFSLPGTAEAAGLSSTVAPDIAQQQQVILTELSQFHYLGFVRKEERGPETARDFAVLTKNDDVHVVRRGEKLENRVLVKAITPDSVTLQDAPSRLEYTVPLSEEAEPQP